MSASVTADQRLAQPEVLDYWDSRHKAKGALWGNSMITRAAHRYVDLSR